MKNLFKFPEDYLRKCKDTSIEERIDFINNYRFVNANQEKPSKPVNLEIPECLLNAFKFKSQLSGIDYQVQIKILMKKWIKN